MTLVKKSYSSTTGELKSVQYGNGDTIGYGYDTWGKVLSVTGSKAARIGTYNPYRYRGYRYDTDTGFYYLQSRYYDPNTGRFISPDDTDILQVTQGDLFGVNLYTYCANDPVMDSDPSGHISMSTLATILDLGLFAVSFTPRGLIVKAFIIGFYVVRIGIAVVQLINAKSIKDSTKRNYAIFDAAYNILVSAMGITATLLSLPRINLSLKTVGTAIYRICQVFGIGLSSSGLAMTWATNVKKPVSFWR